MNAHACRYDVYVHSFKWPGAQDVEVFPKVLLPLHPMATRGRQSKLVAVLMYESGLMQSFSCFTHTVHILSSCDGKTLCKT